jgi:hypothetical protein
MKELDVVDLYERYSEESSSKFLENIESKIHVKTEYDKIEEDTTWMDMFELTLPYIDGIFRNANKFIINEEEIIKIEQTKKVTVESIKHLSKNTNFIQEIDDRTGDVTPSKLLNVRKEETFNTYENRVIYTLVQNMKFFLNKKKEYLLARGETPEKNNRDIDYVGNTKVDGENVNIELHLNSRLEDPKNKKSNTQALLERIELISKKINDLAFTDVYKILEKEGVSLVTPPIKKTNVILKNVRFQYAMKLWEYMQDHLDDESRRVSNKEEREEDFEVKNMVNETFLMNYLIARSLTEEDFKKKEKLKKKATENLVQRIIELNPDLPLEDFKKMVGDKYVVLKNRNVVNTAEIQSIFKAEIDKYLERLK